MMYTGCQSPAAYSTIFLFATSSEAVDMRRELYQYLLCFCRSYLMQCITLLRVALPAMHVNRSWQVIADNCWYFMP